MTVNFILGHWYSSKDQVRAEHGGSRGRILLGSNNDIAVILDFLGSHRTRNGVDFDFDNRRIMCVGEGKAGDQKENPRNLALINAEKLGNPIRVFLDCGELFSPKKLLYVGAWCVRGMEYDSVDGKMVYRFRLEPEDQATANYLVFTFGALGANENFESDLRAFAAVRQRLYDRHSTIVRSRVNIAEDIGEYFAIKMFNLKHPTRPLIRHEYKDASAIQAGTGKRFAIMTIGKIPSMTSNIWSENIDKTVDVFLVTYLDRDLLEPKLVFTVTMSQAAPFLKQNLVQGCRMLHVNEILIGISKTIFSSGKPLR